jgi:hypothetical protein
MEDRRKERKLRRWMLKLAENIYNTGSVLLSITISPNDWPTHSVYGIVETKNKRSPNWMKVFLHNYQKSGHYPSCCILFKTTQLNSTQLNSTL